ncbi:MAG: hypothetical protein ACHQ1D_12485 [Nitrososphaerales archaeon]
MINKIAVTTFLSILTTTLFSQDSDNTTSYNNRNIYYQALARYIEYQQQNSMNQLDTIFMERGYPFTDSLLSQIGDTKLIKLDGMELTRIFKKGKGLQLHRISALEYYNSEFSILIESFFETKEGKRSYALRNMMRFRVIYRFDNGNFSFIRIEEITR